MIEEKQSILEDMAPLSALDRCDYSACSAQAYVRAIGVTGDLLFCSHHYNRIMQSTTGSEKMNGFAYHIIDERDRLIENRLVGEN